MVFDNAFDVDPVKVYVVISVLALLINIALKMYHQSGVTTSYLLSAVCCLTCGVLITYALTSVSSLLGWLAVAVHVVLTLSGLFNLSTF